MSHVASCRYILTGLCWPDVACRTGVENCLDQRRVARDRRRAMDSMNSLKATSFCQSESANHVPAGNRKYLYIIHDITSTFFSTSTIIYWWYRNCSCTILMGAVLPDMELITSELVHWTRTSTSNGGVLWSNKACNLKCRSTSFIPKCHKHLTSAKIWYNLTSFIISILWPFIWVSILLQGLIIKSWRGPTMWHWVKSWNLIHWEIPYVQCIYI